MKRSFTTCAWARFAPVIAMMVLLLFNFSAGGQNIIKAEYFMDADPGFGLGTDVPVTPSANINNLQFSIALGSVPYGFHTLYVRAKDENGLWSLGKVNAFYRSELNTSVVPDITRAEYFMDTDPGFGLGYDIPLTPSANIGNLQFTIGLGVVSAGFHTLYIRAKDGNGRWSLSQVKPFYKLAPGPGALPDVTKVEYFVDTDPGFGMATSIPVVPSSNVSSLQHTIDLASVPAGFHVLYVRAKDGNGRWSISQVKSFYKLPMNTVSLADVTKAEYFIDNDPGFGMGSDIPVSPSANIGNLQFAVDLAAVPVGFHTLYVRAKDGNGRWSLSQVKSFYKTAINPVTLPDITKAEYFIDADPGFGSGVNIPVSPSANISNLQVAIDLAGVPVGFHTLYVRAKDANGRWSLTQVKPFYKSAIPPASLPDVTKVEYFFDTDPGMGMGTNVPVTPSPDLDNLAFTIDLSSLPVGTHTVWIRAKDMNGRWSQIVWDTITQVLPVAGVAITASVNPGCAGTPVNFTATPSNGGANPVYQWKVNGLNAGANSPAFSYAPANNDAVNCVMTSSLASVIGNPATSNTITMAVSPVNPVSISIAASANPVCAGTPVTFTATPANGGSNPAYQWKVNGVNAGTNNTVFAYTPVTGDIVTCILTSNVACATGNPASSNQVAASAAPGPAGTISGPAAVCLGTQGVTYSVSPIPYATGYQWTLPPGVVIASGAGTSTITVNFSNSAFNGNMSVTGTNTCGSGTSSPVLSVASSPLLTGQVNLANINVKPNEQFCEAAQSITTAGSGTTFLVQGTGDVTLIASQYVRLLPGTVVNQAGLLHAFITTQCIPCSLLKVADAGSGQFSGTQAGESIPADGVKPSVIVYPNPTPGNFTLEYKEGARMAHTRVEICNAQGKKLLTEELTDGRRHVFSLSDRPAGVYIIRVITEEGVETVKVIRH